MDCELMNEIATFKPHIVILFILVLISSIAIPLTIYVSFKISTYHLYHINTRILLIAHAIGLVIHLSDRLFLHSWDLYRWLIVLPKSSSACEIISSSERCIFSRFFFNIGLWFCTCSSPVIVLERLLATCNISTYHADRKSWKYFIAIQVLGTVGLLALVYSKAHFGGSMYYCIAANINEPEYAIVACASVTAVQFLSIFGFRYLIKVNRKLKNDLHNRGASLVKRYQVEESLRSLEIMSLPYYAMLVSQFTYALLLVFLLLSYEQLSHPVFYSLLELIIFIPEYSIFFVFTFIYKEKSMNRRSVRTIKNKIDIKPETYFEIYKQSWNV